MIRHHNQPDSWQSARGDGTSHCLDSQIDQQKKYQKYNIHWPQMAADQKFYTQQPTKNMRKLKRMEWVGGESGGDCGLWGVCVLSGRASFGYSTLASEEKAREK